MLKSLIRKLKVFLGCEICPQCGSKNIIKYDPESAYLRYDCQDCDKRTYILGFPN